MLGFFRRYQRFFFLVVTIVIVVSFSFFGTYSSLDSNSIKDPVAFEAVDGTEVLRSHVDEFVRFIGTDATDQMLLGGMLGPNFLNDGLLRKDFLDTGLLEALVAPYLNDLSKDLRSRLDKERHFNPYIHPQARFLSCDAAWGYFAPSLKEAYEKLRAQTDGASADAFHARVQLYLAEAEFPAEALRQVLRYQESQYEWLQPDPQLKQLDLSLFRYHTAEDWFGRRVLQLVAQFVINASKVAESRGYLVSKEEALADLLNNAQTSYHQIKEFRDLPVANSAAYFDDQLHRLGMDRSHAVKVWRQVLLFRRLFHDVGQSVFVDGLAYEKLGDFANEAVSIEQYQLPEELRLNDVRALEHFEHYLDVIAKDQHDPLLLPDSFRTVEQVKQRVPELVQRRYLIAYTGVDKPRLLARVSVKETWQWEIDENHWQTLKQRFPDLGIAEATTPDERFAALDKLDRRTRVRVDNFARAAIVDAHPEWLEEALEAEMPTEAVIGVRYAGAKQPFDGIDDPEAFMRLLDAGHTLIKDDADSENKALDALPLAAPLRSFSADGKQYFRIRVLDSSDDEVLTFAEAKDDGALEKLVEARLEEHYLAIRERNGKEYRRDDGRWKLLSEVRDSVADSLYSSVIGKAHAEGVDSGDVTAPAEATGSYAATRRFLRHLKSLRDRLADNNATVESLVQKAPQAPSSRHLSPRPELSEQWKLVVSSKTVERSKVDSNDVLAAAFDLEEGKWSTVATPANGDLSFFTVMNKAVQDSEFIANKMDEAWKMLGNEAQRVLLAEMLQDFGEKEAIVLQKDEV